VKQRIITAFAILAILIPPIIYGGIPLRILIFTLCAIASYETVSLRSEEPDWLLTILTFFSIVIMYNVNDNYYLPMLSLFIIGLFFISIVSNILDIDSLSYVFLISIIITIACKGFIAIYDMGIFYIFYIGFACYITDSMAYFTGVKYGKHKMIPRISPNKTWEGAFGGYVSGFAVSLVFGLIFLKIPYYLTIFLSLTIPIVSQLGDLAFSSIKRHFDKKDFGSVFPGHGGVLDRLDSLLFTIIYSYAIFYMFNLLV